MAETVRIPPGPGAILQRQVVSYLENPSLQIRRGLALEQMPEQQQKHFLHNLLGIGSGDSKRKQIAKNGNPQLVKQRNDLFVQTRKDAAGRDAPP